MHGVPRHTCTGCSSPDEVSAKRKGAQSGERVIFKLTGMCRQVLLRNEYARRASHIGLQSSTILQREDEHTIVFKGLWCPAGWASALLAPREVVVKRTWRCVGMGCSREKSYTSALSPRSHLEQPAEKSWQRVSSRGICRKAAEAESCVSHGATSGACTAPLSSGACCKPARACMQA
jgi:hypothetical protein